MCQSVGVNRIVADHTTDSMMEHSMESMVRSYYVYKYKRDAAVGKELCLWQRLLTTARHWQVLLGGSSSF